MLPLTPMLSNRNPQTSTFPTANLFQSNGDAFEADWTEISESTRIKLEKTEVILIFSKFTSYSR